MLARALLPRSLNPGTQKTMVRTSLAAIFAALLLALASPRAAALPTGQRAMSWERDKGSPYWVHGRAEVATAPDMVWKRLEDVSRWPQVFTDIKWIRIKERRDGRIRVRLETKTFACGAHDYVIRLDPGARQGTLQIEAPGVDSTARLIVRKGARADQSNVAYSLYVKATGIMGWFISESTLRQKQEQMVERYLLDLETTFGRGRH
jgi:hypothetical protein